MPLDSESACRVVLGLMMAGAAAIGMPYRIRADRAGGAVSVRGDPAWFWIIMAGVAPLVALTCVAFLLNPRWVDSTSVSIPPSLRLAGTLVALMGLWLFGWMFRHLGLNVTSTSMPRATATLVTTGPYRWIRHPMYSAALLLVAAASLLTANLIVLLGGLAMFALLAARSRLEERRLVERFGAAYRGYQHRTGRFLPRWGS